MLVSEIFQRLSTGPLSNLSISGEGSGEIIESGIPKLVNALNASLLKLYTRFVLKESELIIRMIQGKTRYPIHSKYGSAAHLTDPDNTHPSYIIDTLSPYTDDLIKILAVFNSDGREVPLNDTGNDRSVFTPQVRLLQVPNSGDWTALSILYQARSSLVTVDDLMMDVDVPEALHAALIHDVSGQIYSNMNGADNSAKGQEYLAKYEMEVGQVIENDLVNVTVSTSHRKFENRGFV